MTQERPFESVLGEPSASFETQYRAATSSVVVLDRSHLTRVAALGADRENFLQNMLSADVKATPESYGRRACFLTNKGKLVSDLTVFKEAERFVLEMEANRAAPFVEALSRYIISEDVTLRNLEAVDASFSVEGPDAAVLVARITGAPPDTIEGLEHLATRGAGEATIIAHRNAPSRGSTSLQRRSELGRWLDWLSTAAPSAAVSVSRRPVGSRPAALASGSIWTNPTSLSRPASTRRSASTRDATSGRRPSYGSRTADTSTESSPASYSTGRRCRLAVPR